MNLIIRNIVQVAAILLAANLTMAAQAGAPNPPTPAAPSPAQVNSGSATKSPAFSRTGWNARARQRFTYPPVLTYTPAPSAASYLCQVSWSDVWHLVHTQTLESPAPRFDLAQVWPNMPDAALFQVTAEAIDSQGRVVASVVSDCRRKASFKGSSHPAKRSYDESGTMAVAWLLKNKPTAYVQRFPILLLTAYMRVLTTYVRLHPHGDLAPQALAAAKMYAQTLLGTSSPPDWVYANVPRSHTAHIFQVPRGGMAGMAYLDLYAVTQEKTWLDAAGRTADTLKKTQLPEGRWPFRVDPQTGKVLQNYTSDQVEAILLLDRLIRDYSRTDLVETRDKAVAWMLANPCRTFLWQEQWDDVGPAAPYANLSWFDAGLFTEYLLRHATAQNGYEAIARSLMEYVENQFVEWAPEGEPFAEVETHLPKWGWAVPPWPAGSEITPGVREQYYCYYVIDGHAAHFIRICMDFYARTHQDIWLQKARAIADTLTASQSDIGYYPTWMQYTPNPAKPHELTGVNYRDVWPNATSMDGEALMRLGDYVKEGKTR